MTFRKRLGSRFQRPSTLSFERLEPRRVLASLLVNFEDGGAVVNSVSFADFAVADPNIDLSAPVNAVEAEDVSVNGSDGVVANITIDGEPGDFDTTIGLYADTPILDSYLVNRSASSFDTVTVSSLEEFNGTVTVVLYGVGDRANQESEFDLIYNGQSLGRQTTDYDANNFEDTFVTYTFTKVAGVDSLEIGFRNAGNGAANGAFNGFSISDNAAEAVRINVGGQEHTDAAGNVFLSDRFFSGGSAGSTNDDIFIVGTGTNFNNDSDVDDILYQTNRFSPNLTYEIPVANGVYDLRLHFAETFFTSENLRVFDVDVEGVEVLDNFDIFGTRFNAFTPGHDASFVEDFFSVEVSDGFLSLTLESQGNDGINNALLSAIEVLPITEPNVVLLPTNGSTVVAEAGLADSFAVALTQAPSSNVTVQIAPNAELNFSGTTFTFTPTNFDVPQTIAITAIDDNDGEGQQNVPVQLTATSADPDYDGITRTLNVTVIDDDLVPVDFDVRTLTNAVNNPTTGTFGPDGRLYVANQNGVISAFTLDNDNNIIAIEQINTFADQADPGFILGIAFNPFEEDAPDETATLS